MYFSTKGKFVIYRKDRSVSSETNFEKADDPAIYINAFLNENPYFTISLNFI